MFLAVCYREAGEEKLQEFRDKTEGEKKEKKKKEDKEERPAEKKGKDGEMEEIMETLAKPLEQQKVVKSKINCTQYWFTGNHTGTPQYYYDEVCIIVSFIFEHSFSFFC